MANIKISFWKIFSFLSFIGVWAEESLSPDEDGVVRITIEELGKLAEGICNVFGWKAEIVMPENTDTSVEGIVD